MHAIFFLLPVVFGAEYWDEIPDQAASLKGFPFLAVSVLLGSEGGTTYDDRGKIQPGKIVWNEGFQHHLGLQRETLLPFVLKRLEREQITQVQHSMRGPLQLMIVVQVRKQDHVYPWVVRGSVYQTATLRYIEHRTPVQTWGMVKYGVCDENSSIRIRHAVDDVITKFVADWKTGNHFRPPR